MPKSIPEQTVQQYLSGAALYSAHLKTEAEAFHALVAAADLIRPSVIFRLARLAKDQKHFSDLLKNACAAAAFPDRAETFASFSGDSFSHDQPEKADAAWQLAVLAAGQAVEKNQEWADLRAAVRLALNVSKRERDFDAA